MLKQISCDKLAQHTIIFHDGLNPIIGDDVATNSIGKSIMLMIIDFVFGGEDYINKKRDVFDNIGDHSFKFVFEFENKCFYFSRSTNDHSVVFECDENFVFQKSITVPQFNLFLQEKYNCLYPYTTFRDIVGRYFRVYGKENLNEKKPIQYFDKETYQQSLIALLKLFNKYGNIKEINSQFDHEKKKKDVLQSAMKLALVPAMKKIDYEKNRNAVAGIEVQIAKIKEDIVKSPIDVSIALSEEVVRLREERANLIIKLSSLKRRLARIEMNLDSEKTCSCAKFDSLKSFFPDVNIRKLVEIDEFHRSVILNFAVSSSKCNTQSLGIGVF